MPKESKTGKFGMADCAIIVFMCPIFLSANMMQCMVNMLETIVDEKDMASPPPRGAEMKADNASRSSSSNSSSSDSGSSSSGTFPTQISSSLDAYIDSLVRSISVEIGPSNFNVLPFFLGKYSSVSSKFI